MHRIQHDQPRLLRFYFNDREVEALEGQTVAAALLAAREYVWRRTARRGQPRGLFCGMGVCYDCFVSINGQLNQQACLTPVVHGMRVETQVGNGCWSDLP